MTSVDTDGRRILAAVRYLRPHQHVCSIYENKSDQISMAVAFIRGGLERGETLYIADTNEPEAILTALQGHGSSIPYAASKAALNCMTKSLARAFGPKVRVNAVAPGPVKTRWLANRQEQLARSLQGTPLGRAAEPEDIADAIYYLALGTTLTTGQVLVVDGGRTM